MSLYGQRLTPSTLGLALDLALQGSLFASVFPQEVSSLNYKPKAGGERSWEASGRGFKLPMRGRAEGLVFLSAQGQAACWLNQKRECSISDSAVWGL